jgi:MYXO-CTERM domain-containing protein
MMICLWITGIATVEGAVASVEVYFDFEEWQSALSATTTIDFAGFPQATVVFDEFEEQGVLFPTQDTFILNGCSNFPTDCAGLHSGIISGNITMQFLGPIYGIGTHFIGDNQTNLFNDGQLIYSSLGWNGPAGSFVGYVSTQPFTEAVIASVGTVPINVIDDLHFGVPGPGALPLLALAGAIGGRRRRQV